MINENFMEKILRLIRVLQVVSNEDRRKRGLERLGQGYSEAYRLNPFNPLSYLFLLVATPIFLLMYGVIGFFEEKLVNPFKWS